MKTNKTKKTVAVGTDSLPKPAKNTPTPKKGAYAPYPYAHIMRCVDCVRDIICDVSNGMLKKNTTTALLHNALATLDVVKEAFHDSEADIGNIEFKIFSK